MVITKDIFLRKYEYLEREIRKITLNFVKEELTLRERDPERE